MAGVFNGRNSTGPSHRARIPSTNSVNITNGNLFAAALDVERAAYFRQWNVGSAVVQQRFYAHRTMRNVLVSSLELISSPTESVIVKLKVNEGNSSSDINFSPSPSPPGTKMNYGCIHITEQPNSG